MTCLYNGAAHLPTREETGAKVLLETLEMKCVTFGLMDKSSGSGTFPFRKKIR